MRITAKARFLHGSHDLQIGDSADVPESTAKELARAGLAIIKTEKKAPEPENKMARKTANKAQKAD